ncbi:hypothetical protein NQ314_002418 [Rhamnusium bicolor]|uniref:Tetraspanin n=1 Tax=Rhamnusium bicolor TaxID=1586634 RepID=A0AAV8ZRI2_9CUCU|nr:hypothetical protein NQ314_002418 [Rhamnusium bicolor]
MGCCEVFTRCISAVFATFFMISGIGLIAYGGFSWYCILITNSDKVIKGQDTLIPPVAIIVFGITLIIVYCAILILLAFCQISFGGYCIQAYNSPKYKANLDLQLSADMKQAVINYENSPQRMDEIQTLVSVYLHYNLVIITNIIIIKVKILLLKLKCCGHVDPLNEYGEDKLPLSCCDSSDRTCTKDNIHEDSCTDLVYKFILATSSIVGCISIVIGAAEVCKCKHITTVQSNLHFEVHGK